MIFGCMYPQGWLVGHEGIVGEGPGPGRWFVRGSAFRIFMLAVFAWCSRLLAICQDSQVIVISSRGLLPTKTHMVAGVWEGENPSCSGSFCSVLFRSALCYFLFCSALHQFLAQFLAQFLTQLLVQFLAQFCALRSFPCSFLLKVGKDFVLHCVVG